MNETEKLNYDCNHNMFLAKTMLSNLTLTDRQKVIRWMRKLANCNKTVDEMKLRNDFMYYLVLNVQTSKLRLPFSENPPQCPLEKIIHLLPGGNETLSAAQTEAATDWIGQSNLGMNTSKQPLLYSNSPDGGEFLAAQPIPRCGAFCYLAVISKSQPRD